MLGVVSPRLPQPGGSLLRTSSAFFIPCSALMSEVRGFLVGPLIDIDTAEIFRTAFFWSQWGHSVSAGLKFSDCCSSKSRPHPSQWYSYSGMARPPWLVLMSAIIGWMRPANLACHLDTGRFRWVVCKSFPRPRSAYVFA